MWQGIREHDEIAAQFRTTLRRGRLASTYLFVGPEGIGKRRFALALARALLCQHTGDPGAPGLDPCGHCESCRLFDGGNHPDLDLVGLPNDKSTLPLDLFIGDKDHRNQDGMCHRIALRPFLGGRKIAIIDDADHFSAESANCLLKTLEEPPPRSLLILIGTSPSRQLPTIRSRSQVMRFRALSVAAVADILLENNLAADRSQAEELARHGNGSVSRALQLADSALWEFRETLLREFSSGVANPVRMAKSIQTFVDEAGKEASDRRERLRTIIAFAESHLRDALRVGAANANVNPTADQTNPGTRASKSRVISTQKLLDSLDICLSTEESVNRNANLALVIQNWCEKLGEYAVSK